MRQDRKKTVVISVFIIVSFLLVAGFVMVFSLIGLKKDTESRSQAAFIDPYATPSSDLTGILSPCTGSFESCQAECDTDEGYYEMPSKNAWCVENAKNNKNKCCYDIKSAQDPEVTPSPLATPESTNGWVDGICTNPNGCPLIVYKSE